MHEYAAFTAAVTELIEAYDLAACGDLGYDQCDALYDQCDALEARVLALYDAARADAMLLRARIADAVQQLRLHRLTGGVYTLAEVDDLLNMLGSPPHDTYN